MKDSYLSEGSVLGLGFSEVSDPDPILLWDRIWIRVFPEVLDPDTVPSDGLDPDTVPSKGLNPDTVPSECLDPDKIRLQPDPKFLIYIVFPSPRSMKVLLIKPRI